MKWNKHHIIIIINSCFFNNRECLTSFLYIFYYHIGSGTVVLTHGKHSLPFTFCLPQHLPSSFEGAYGSINYLVTAQLHTDNERNDDLHRISHPIQVRRFLDLSQGVAYGNAIAIPSSIERPQKTLRTALVPNKPKLKFIFKVQKTGFSVGEIVPFVLDVFNPVATLIWVGF